jgi:hypothetical protein
MLRKGAVLCGSRGGRVDFEVSGCDGTGKLAGGRAKESTSSGTRTARSGRQQALPSFCVTFAKFI